jgi:hypothetical protein
MGLREERRDMGLNCGIIKHAGDARIPGAAAASRRIDDDLSGPGIPGREDQRDDPDQANRDPNPDDDQLPSAPEKVDELAQVKSRRLLRVRCFVSATRFVCHG